MQQVSLESSSGMCTNSIENRVTATTKVSGDRKEMQGKTVYFKMKLFLIPEDPFWSVVDGPISFEGISYSYFLHL